MDEVSLETVRSYPLHDCVDTALTDTGTCFALSQCATGLSQLLNPAAPLVTKNFDG